MEVYSMPVWSLGKKKIYNSHYLVDNEEIFRLANFLSLLDLVAVFEDRTGWNM